MGQPSSPTVIARGDVVYFIATTCRTYVKIGRSNDATRRLKTLQTSSPLKLVLLGAVHAKPAYEKYLHACFAKNRTHGEWFLNNAKLQHTVDVILAQQALNFPEFEHAPEIEGHSILEFFKLFASTPEKPIEPVDPLDEYLRSPEYARNRAERNEMTQDELKRLHILETAQTQLLKVSQAQGGDEVLTACKATRDAYWELGLDTTSIDAIVEKALEFLSPRPADRHGERPVITVDV